MKCLIPLSLIFVLFHLSAAGQFHSELWSLYSNFKDKEAETKAREYLSADPNDAHALQVLGQLMFDVKKYDSAVAYSERAIQLDAKHKNDFTFEAHLCKAKALYMLGKHESAKMELEKSVNKNASVNARKYVAACNGIMGLNGQYEKWYKLETEHMVFHIEDTVVKGGLKGYVDSYERAYDTINAIFQAKLPAKIQFYVWKDGGKDNERKARTVIIQTDPELLIIHNALTATKGHNITHILAYWASENRVDTNRLINEGIAHAFDLSGDDFTALAKKSVEEKYIRGIEDIWKNAKIYDTEITQSVGAALVSFLRNRSSTEKIRSLALKQDYESAREIFGSDFGKLMQEFNSLMGWVRQ
jgi:tetratricopeptide (TPR) repeat protein